MKHLNSHPSTAVPLLPRQGIIRKLFVAHQGTTVNALEWEKPSRTKTPPSGRAVKGVHEQAY